ncbi:MAG: 2Fe-2S iron-sulfur cluster binding domain-containing protein [Sedimentisphaerales bacterium]|nr:2Fe-2S iron-sulfur cluster binding domain-containing protein [Sedimentisphaerales bacterium]
MSAISAGLAAVLVVAEFFLRNYGECKITINGEKDLVIDGGGSLLASLVEQKIFIPSACGGRGTCGLCKVKVPDGAGSLLPTEEPYLDKKEIAGNMRLSCQVKVRNDLKIEIPEELFNIKEYSCSCEEIRDLTHDIKLFRFKLIEPPDIKFTPGQYMQLLAPIYEKSKEEVYRAYSIASDSAQKDIIDLIIRFVPGGICTTYCFEYLNVGDKVKMNGAYGEFRLSETDADMLWIAGGSGMAPFVSILHYMKNTGNKRKVTYYFGANKVKELFLLDEMRQFEKDLPNFRFVPVVYEPEEEWNGETGLVTKAVGRNEKNIADCEGYLCGSGGMIDASIEVLKKLGLDEDKIYYDKFA